MKTNRRNLGIKGERAVEVLLKQQGYRILDRNFRSRFGEIDLIVTKGNSLVFVEVKTRSTNAFGFPEEAVDPKKQRQVRRMAAEYISKCGKKGYFSEIRFDVAAVTANSDGQVENIRILEGAF